MLFFRSLLYALGMWLSTLLIAPLAVLYLSVPVHGAVRLHYPVGPFQFVVAEVSCGLRYRVHGRDRIPSANAIVFCKHQSAWGKNPGPAADLSAAKWLLKRELLWVPFFGGGSRCWSRSQSIGLCGTQGGRAAGGLGKERLANGRWV